MWSKTATVSTSASTARRRRAGRWLALVVLLAGWQSSAAVAGPRLDTFQGHISLGYGKLFAETAPGGSLSFAGGVDYPVRRNWSAGLEVGYWLLGTRLVDRGSVGAELDYSVFETVAQARWKLPHHPFEIAMGPGVFHARSDLTSSGAAGFGDLATEQTVGGMALGVTAIQSRPSAVRVGLEIAARLLWVSDDVTYQSSPVVLGLTMPNWNLVSGRLAIHY